MNQTTPHSFQNGSSVAESKTVWSCFGHHWDFCQRNLFWKRWNSKDQVVGKVEKSPQSQWSRKKQNHSKKSFVLGKMTNNVLLPFQGEKHDSKCQ